MRIEGSFVLMKWKLIPFVAMVLAIFCTGPTRSHNDRIETSQQHIDVSMRMIGHRVLLWAGNDSSLVKPVVKNGDNYFISFDAEFGFSPDSLAMVIDNVISETQISENYVVEFVTCDTDLTVNSYEVSERDNVLACRGRDLPVSCYSISITLLDVNSSEAGIMEPMEIADGQENGFGIWLFALLVLMFVFIVAYVVLKKRRQGKDRNSHVIGIGEFLFNKRNMELTIRDQRIELTSKEAGLLQLLLESVNHTVKREDILNVVWGDDGDYVGRTLDVFISKLRKKLEADKSVKIVNTRGIGYKLILTD